MADEPKDRSDSTLPTINATVSLATLRSEFDVNQDTKQLPQRRADGTLMPGSTANPAGHRARMPTAVRQLLIDATPKAAKAYIDALDAERIWTDQQGGEHSAPDHGIRVAAATAILDRVCGKPSQAVTGEDGGPIQVDVGIIGVLRRLAGESEGA